MLHINSLKPFVDKERGLTVEVWKTKRKPNEIDRNDGV